MRKKLVAVLVSCMSFLFAVGCGSQKGEADTVNNNANTNVSVEAQVDSAEASSGDAVNAASSNLGLSDSECVAEIDKLLQTQEVKPDKADILSKMAWCVTEPRIFDKGQGMVFSKNEVELEEPVITDTITITITGAEKGERYDDTCISEILVY